MSDIEPSAIEDLDGLEVVNKELNLEERIPSGETKYIQTTDEIDRVKSRIKDIDNGGRGVRYVFSGESGTGKTVAAKDIAQEFELPIFQIQGKYTLNESHLLGRVVLTDESSKFVYGKLTQAIRASNEQKVMLFIDEINRIREDGKGTLMSVLESERAEVTIDARGGEKITGNPQNIIFIGTKNEGYGYETKDMDLAERRRFAEIEFDFLGLQNKEEEIKLVMDKGGANRLVAEFIVTVANEVRRAVIERQVEIIKKGMPPALLIDWADAARAYANDGITNPLLKGAEDEIAKPFYGDRDMSYNEVMNIFRDNIDGAPYDENELETWIGTDVEDMVNVDTDGF